MTRIQQVLFELEGDYYGHPYYVTGNALYHALAQRVSAATRRVLCVSHGIFVPSERGPFPAAHSSAPANKRLGTRLPPVERYSDLFLYRDAAHRWIGDTQPRDTTNTHELRSHGGRVTYGPATRIGQPPNSGIDKWTHTMHVHCYLHTSGPAGEVEFPLSKETLDGLQVGGGRNYGLGRLSVADTRTVDLDSLSTPVLDAADDYVIELLSPYVLATDHPDSDNQQVPWWWAPEATALAPQPGGDPDETGVLRRRKTRLVADGACHALSTVDHGQVVGYAGSDPLATALNGVTRVGSHAKFGFGEFRLRPASADRVPDRTQEPERASVATDGGTGVDASSSRQAHPVPPEGDER